MAIISVAAISYAQSSKNKNMGQMMDMMGGLDMDKMHKEMTKNLDQKTKEQMDKMHKACEQHHNDDSENSNNYWGMGMMQEE